MKKIAFVINTYNRAPDILGACIASIQSQQPVESTVVVVDQNQEPLGPGIPGTTVVHHPDKCISVARNAGCGSVEAEWYVFLDDDGTLRPGAIAALLSVIDDPAEDWDIVGGKVFVRGTGETYCLRQNIGRGRLSFIMLNAIMGGILAIRGRVFRELGGFDERFGIGAAWWSGEESDFTVRAYRQGKKVLFLPTFAIDHPDAGEMNDAKVKKYALGKGALVRKHLNSGWSPSVLLEAVDAFGLPIVEAGVYLLCFNFKNARRAVFKLVYRAKGFHRFC
jgi:GT2 family glycosyltransferase